MYSENQTIRQMKKNALSNLKGNWKSVIGTYLVYFLLSAHVITILTIFSMFLDFFLSISRSLMGLPLLEIVTANSLKIFTSIPMKFIMKIIRLILVPSFLLGKTKFFFNIFNGKKPQFKDLFYAYTNRNLLLKSIELNFMINFFCTLWTIVFAIPIFILTVLVLKLPNDMFFIVLVLLLIIPVSIIYIRYSMSFYVLYNNPEVGILECIDISKKIMYGNKFRFFKLCLSFSGWFLLEFITLALALVFVNPYYEMSKINFYEEITSMQEKNI